MSLNVRAISKLVHDFPWFHRWVGAAGNTAFFVGSAALLFGGSLVASDVSTWLFILGSLGMMIDSFGEKLYRYEEESANTTASPQQASQ